MLRHSRALHLEVTGDAARRVVADVGIQQACASFLLCMTVNCFVLASSVAAFAIPSVAAVRDVRHFLCVTSLWVCLCALYMIKVSRASSTCGARQAISTGVSRASFSTWREAQSVIGEYVASMLLVFNLVHKRMSLFMRPTRST